MGIIERVIARLRLMGRRCWNCGDVLPWREAYCSDSCAAEHQEKWAV